MSALIPPFLKEFKSKIEKFRLESVHIKATPLEKGEHASIKQSKFLGVPYLPIAMEYPYNKFGKPLVLVAQINFAEIPDLENFPTKGIWQVFTSPMFWDLGNEYYLYLYHEDTDQPYHTDFSFLTDDLYDRLLPIDCEHTLTFSKKTEFGGISDFKFDIDFNGKSFYEFRENLSEKQQDELWDFFKSTGHKIGGYAFFTQFDLRSFDSDNKDDILFLQIDNDDRIMFGDAGVSHFFINIDSLRKKDFSKTYFHWDCA